MSMKLTNNEQWILDFLKGKDYVSPTKIGYAHTHASGITGEHHTGNLNSREECVKVVSCYVRLRNSGIL